MSESKQTPKAQTIPDTQQPASLWQVIKSVAASMIGVQSQNNHKHDFQQKSFVPYLIVGIAFVAVFIATLLLVVKLILP